MFDQVSLSTALGVLAGCALVIALVGTRLTRTADQLADRTHMGEALAGGVLLGAVTSLPGITVSVAAGLHGQPGLALGNAVGGIAVQTLFLAIADVFYTRANLEHAAASLENVVQGCALLVLLAVMGMGRYMPEVTILGAHPASWLLIFAYGYGLRIVSHVRAHPMWNPERTDETRQDVPEHEQNLPSLARLWMSFAPLALTLALSGYVLELVVTRITELTSLNVSVAGLLLTSTCTSLPELVTSIAAVRRGALTLAVGGIIGGNMFDTLFAAAADFSYQQGSIYHDAPDNVIGWIMLCILMMSVLVLGLVRREKYGVARIGLESVVIPVCYAAGVWALSH